MRPQHCCCGNYGATAGVGAREASFNEAAALLLRKSERLTEKRRELTLLQ